MTILKCPKTLENLKNLAKIFRTYNLEQWANFKNGKFQFNIEGVCVKFWNVQNKMHLFSVSVDLVGFSLGSFIEIRWLTLSFSRWYFPLKVENDKETSHIGLYSINVSLQGNFRRLQLLLIPWSVVQKDRLTSSSLFLPKIPSEEGLLGAWLWKLRQRNFLINNPGFCQN